MSTSDNWSAGKPRCLRDLRYLLRADLYRYKGRRGFWQGARTYLRIPGFRFTFWMRLAAFLRARLLLAPLYLIAHILLS